MSTTMREENQYIATLKGDRMKKSQSTESLSSLAGCKSCVCSPTMHPGSFRCRYHRQPSNQISSSSAASAQKADAAEEALPPASSPLKEEKAKEGK